MPRTSALRRPLRRAYTITVTRHASARFAVAARENDSTIATASAMNEQSTSDGRQRSRRGRMRSSRQITAAGTRYGPNAFGSAYSPWMRLPLAYTKRSEPG